MRKLIAEGADVNYGQKKGKLPILMLTSHDYPKTEFLLKRGANINASYKFNEKDGTVTALKNAMNNNNIPMVELLLSYNPKFNHPATIVKSESLSMPGLFIKSRNLTSNDYCVCISESLFNEKIILASFFIKFYTPAQNALSLFKILKNDDGDGARIINRDKVIFYMEQFNNLSDDEFSQLNIKNYSGSKKTAIALLYSLKHNTEKAVDRKEILLYMQQFNNLSDYNFKGLLFCLNSELLEAIVKSEPSE
jgi:ankyrin repeat protein